VDDEASRAAGGSDTAEQYRLELVHEVDELDVASPVRSTFASCK